MKENKLWSRILSMLLCAVMVLSCLTGVSMPAKAETVAEEPSATVETLTEESTEPEIVEQEKNEPVNEPKMESAPAVRKPAVKSAASLAQDTYTSADEKWSFVPYGEGVQITAYHGNATDVYVPFKVTYNEEDYAVLKLADSLFADNDGLNSVTLGEGILKIGAKTFYDCDNLVCIVTNETMTTIGAEAFYSCDSFNSVILYDAVATIGANAFAECPKLTIWCNENTTAYTYATANSIPYEILNPNATPENYIQDGITYYIMNGQAIAIAFDESTVDVVVPGYIAGYPVIEVRGTFHNCIDLKTVILPETLLRIGENSFYNCDAIQNIIIPGGVTLIGDSAFYGCDSLKNIDIPPSVKVIGTSAFYDSALENIVIPDSVVSIMQYAFGFCYFLKTVSIPESITKLETGVFEYCSNLQSITIPNSVTHISISAFKSCDSLQELTIPENVTSIGSYAFAYCTALQKVNLPDKLIVIGNGAFTDCLALDSILIPKNVMSVYSDCFPLSTVIIVYKNSYAHSYFKTTKFQIFVYDGTNMPMLFKIDGIYYFVEEGRAVAYNCDKSIVEATIPAYIEEYPVTELRNVFQECTNLKKVVLPETLQCIGEYAFYNCKYLTTVSIPNGVQRIESHAFAECKRLNKVTFPNSVTYIGEYAFYNCEYLHDLIIPDNVITIGDRAFYNCNLITNICIPDSVTSLGDSAFGLCSALQSVSISKGITSIGSSVFYMCTALQSVEIPDSVTSIGRNSFSGCSKLQSVMIPNSVTSIESSAFADCSSLETIIIPQNTSKMYADSFAASTIIMVYENSYAHNFAEENDLLYCIYDGINTPPIYKIDGVSYIVYQGSAIAYRCDQTVLNLIIPAYVEGYPVSELRNTFNGCARIITISLPETLRIIGDKAFYGCKYLQCVNIPDGVTSIGSYAFDSCLKITELVIPDSVTSIESNAFRNCCYMQKIVLSSNIASIPERMLSACSRLKEVTIPNGVTSIGYEAFSSCRALENISIPNGVTKIEESVFSDCASLKSIVIPNSVTSIESHAFNSCTSLKSIDIPNSVTSIGPTTFAYCTALQSIKIPDGIQTIERYTFSNCTSLQNVYIPETVITVDYYAFTNCNALRTIVIPRSVTKIYKASLPVSVILLVYENSYAHTFAKNKDLLHFVIRKTENPEIRFGAGISGNVSYLDGAAAANATVEIFYDDGVLKESVVTDDTGAYEFTYAEVGAYTIRVTDTSGNTATTAISVKRMNAFDVYLSGDTDLKLKKGYSVGGTVNTYPATITITDEDGNVLGSVETTDGNFTFENISNGTYIITATTENGSISQEITVFDGNVTEIVLTITATSATLWGYVEVEDRDLSHNRRNWVEVTVYNADALVVAQCKTDKDGKYTFTGLPVGEYSIVAQTAEMRPDHQHGFDRSHTLTGYAYIAVTEVGTYQVETIVLREENDGQATLSGKVTAHGETQDCQVVLQDVFRSEIASMTTGKNGKYSFKNVSDGLYFITATTQSDGMGYTVVTVRNGKVYGQTDITVYKSDKVQAREDRFFIDVPYCGSREDALQYRDRIAEEKRFYDGLSEKEKKQLSEDYVSRLDRLVLWITDCDVQTGDGITLEQGGLVISGDEAQKAENITFTLNVIPSEAHNASTDGVNNREDQIHHNINDKANKHDVLQYYDITLSKEVDGVSTQITSVTKDTEANGKLRVTMEIPEEYRGYKHYTIIHEHCGEVVTLTDLDDNPDTVTFEVKKFSTFVLAGTNITLTEIVDEESSIVESWGLTLTDAIVVNFTMNESALADANAYVEVTTGENVINISAAEAAKGIHVTLAAARMNEIVSLCVIDGSGNRSQSSSYTVRQYCDAILADESYSEYHALVKEMLNYGAMAQLYFDYDTENLANVGITGTAATDVPETTDDLTVSGKFSGVKFYGASLVYRDRIAVRYYFTGDVTGLTFTANGNAHTPVAKDEMYYVEIADILPQDLDRQITLTVTDANRNILSVTYGPMNYIARMNEKGSNTLKALVKALYNYHLAAKALTA